MSFLAPLFFAGAAAIALPILFHLIRRTSREKVTFSSLMFLTPSPPRVTRKSRLENILLLLLRCAVIALLATAFARPFFRNSTATPVGNAKRIVLLVDASASMKRDQLWTDAKAKAAEFAKNASAGDELALMTFDRGARTVLTFADWNAAPVGGRAALVTQRLQLIEPSFAATQLGNAMLSANELLDHENTSALAREIIVMSDVQDGAKLDGLQGFIWPRNTSVQMVQLKSKRPTNAGVQILPEPVLTASGAEIVKARISNSAESKREQFQVRWSSTTTNTIPVYVPPGQSRTIELPKPAAADRAILTGDDADFDNAAWFVPPSREQINVLFVGNDSERDPKQQLFYLQRAFADTTRQSVRVLPVASGAPLPETNVSVIVIGSAPQTERLTALGEKLRGGATVLWPIASATEAQALTKLVGLDIAAEEASSGKYSMFAEIDFAHPLFVPFADARFSDFTKIHFWKHRKLTFEATPTARVLARFDNGDPAIAQFSVGKGTLLALASGWHPGDSQLALSSKFVPLLYSVLELSGAIKAQALAFSVGDVIDLNGVTAAKLSVRKPDGSTADLATGTTKFSATDQIGVYSVLSAQPPFQFAVNLAPEETKTSPLAIEELQKLGVPLNAALASTPEREARRAANLQGTEIESRQKLWRWLIAATLMVLMVETIVAARLSRRVTTPAGT
ncbi:MAG TPA: BatA domain-containing protein [Candidatus Acidoferrum sp.]|nr:BatA domain-containing protein [Candidatus Acidoferrum sp.]